jgi:hypothetical protein
MRGSKGSTYTPDPARSWDDLPATKQCSRCERVRPKEAFRIARTRNGGAKLSWICLECEPEYNRQRQGKRTSYYTCSDPVERAVRIQRRRDQQRELRAKRRKDTKKAPDHKGWARALTAAERLPSQPLRDWITETFPYYKSSEEVAVAVRVSAHTIRNIYDEDVVTVTVADAIFTHLGRPDLLEQLYPLGST